MKQIMAWGLALALLLALAPAAAAQSAGKFDLSWCTLESSAGCLSAGVYRLDTMAGQPDSATLTGGALSLSGGYLGPCDPTLKILSPAGNETWRTCDPILIHWWSDVAVAGTTVRFELWRGAKKQATLANDSSTSGDHLVRLSLPGNIAGGADCRLRAVSILLENINNPNPYIEVGPLNVITRANAADPRAWALYD